MSGIFSLLSAAKANQRQLEATSNNIANANTNGYKADVPVFKQHLDKAVGVDLESEEENFADNQFLTPYSLGSSTYVITDDVLASMEDGGFEYTANPTDLALSGDGFFTVETPYGRRYTRNGQFEVNQDGFLVTTQGHYVLGNNGPIQVNDGLLNVTEDGLAEVDGVFVDKFLIREFEEPERLTKMGGSYFAISSVKQQAKDAENFRMEQGMLEKSNVNTVDQMVSLINVNRAYQAAQRAIRTMDDLDERAISLTR